MKDFDSEVYELIREIPHGRIATYGQIACLIGMPNHARRVGRALADAPPDIPCHRIVSAAGGLVPEWRAQRQLLEAEGVRFRHNGCADLQYNAWEAAVAMSKR